MIERGDGKAGGQGIEGGAKGAEMGAKVGIEGGQTVKFSQNYREWIEIVD